MDYNKIGKLIYRLRKEKGLTQKKLAEDLYISEQAVSKWERGLGCPDVSLLSELSKIFEVNLEDLLSGELMNNESLGDKMKNTNFYACKECGNIITSTGKEPLSCCSKKILPLERKKASEEDMLKVENIENDYYISSSHEMTKGHYIGFVALLTGDTMILKKQYPEWNLSLRIPRISHGILVHYCSQHGLMYQIV